MLPCLARPEQQVSAAAVYGRPEVINVWASWCSPCRREAPILEAAHQAAGERILFLGVDTRDTRPAAWKFVREFGMTYPQLFDSTGIFVSRLGSAGIPYTVVVDASGRIVYRRIGELTADQLQYGLSRLEPASPR